MSTFFSVIAAALALLLIAACPGSASDRPVSACRKSYTQCKTAKGPLGVCTPVACKPGEKRPCFICAPQH